MPNRGGSSSSTFSTMADALIVARDVLELVKDDPEEARLLFSAPKEIPSMGTLHVTPRRGMMIPVRVRIPDEVDQVAYLRFVLENVNLILMALGKRVHFIVDPDHGLKPATLQEPYRIHGVARH